MVVLRVWRKGEMAPGCCGNLCKRGIWDQDTFADCFEGELGVCGAGLAIEMMLIRDELGHSAAILVSNKLFILVVYFLKFI